jgi:N-methylhydantoinase A
LEVSYPANEFNDGSVRDLWRRFHEEHTRRFGFCIPGETIELVNLTVVAVSVLRKPDLRELPKQVGVAEPQGKRRVRFEEGWIDAPVYDRDTMGQGSRISGPAVIEEAASATVVSPVHQFFVDRFGNLLISA